MTTRGISDSAEWTVADIQERFGPVPVRRIRLEPSPGAAVEQDVIDIHANEKRLYELVDGVLVEKSSGFQEAYVAALLGSYLGGFSTAQNLGIIVGANGMCRLAPGLVRIPDVAFIAWDRLPGRRVPAIAFIPFSPNLVVEVLSPGNTRQEMQRKLIEYFDTGSTLVWYVDPRTRTVRVFGSPANVETLGEGDTLDGGNLLPGFQLAVSTIFAQLERAG